MTTEQGDHATKTRGTPALTHAKYSKRVVLNTILCTTDEGFGFVGERVVVGGWVKSSKERVKDTPGAVTSTAATTPTTTPRDVTCVELFQSRIPLLRTIFKVFGGTSSTPLREKLEFTPAKPVPVPSIGYLQVNDGSCAQNLQVVIDSSKARVSQFTPTGTSIIVEGVLRKPSVPGKHVIELEVEKIIHVGTVDTANYPLAKTRIPLDSLRSYSHFRPRTTTVASVTRIRSSLSQATNIFSQNHGFLYMHMPVITGIDPKGYSEKFHVTTLSEKDQREEPNEVVDTGSVNLDVVKDSIKEKSKKIEELKRSESNKEALAIALQDLLKTNELASQIEARQKSNPKSFFKARKDSSKDFFPRQMYLASSDQLHLESYACALGNVYAFAPTFQAEKSRSTKHLAESWMVEFELAFADLESSDDMKFVTSLIDQTIVDRLQSVVSSSFVRITYAEAVEALTKVTDMNFEAKIEWGVVLTDEHESYLAEKIYKSPVIIYNPPKEQKPFYARVNDDGKTVATIDVIVPKAGTLVRGSQKEERFDKLSTRMKEFNSPREQFEWYLDLRRHGTVKHSGFSLEFDHMVLFATGLTDIRDVTAFPRTFGSANY
ncbi:hypothetical protein IFM89_023091 [Coptis chinensis]|uniref:Aminoacyl-tRNA synthetase class II (D/K/N) domain-containing protein n=1 Tax=Coptis chinensis TaxID=261450 RepID=A0A835LS31_9MAGN|nr:hypothetical protein IFM89_023091 [Coptis chinensis]